MEDDIYTKRICWMKKKKKSSVRFCLLKVSKYICRKYGSNPLKHTKRYAFLVVGNVRNFQ